MAPHQVTLQRDLARALREGHPWVFRDALASPPEIEHGARVEVCAVGGRVLATGFWDARSPIAVRVLATGAVDDLDALVKTRVDEAIARRLAVLDLARTNAFRCVHGEGDRLPGIHVDRYDRVAVVRFDGDGARAFYRELPALLDVDAVVDRQGKALRGSVPEEVVVLENGLRFEVAPGRGCKGGLFLDQRENRQEVERRASGRSVLNLFGYTGGFSLYAARGGARSTDTVDVAGPALEAARRNFARNDLPLDRAAFHAEDAFAFLERAAIEGRTWDLVVSDPPSFAPRKAAVPEAQKAYTRLHRLAAAVTTPGGILCAASCSSHVGRDDFLMTIAAGARAARRRFALEAVRGAAADHPVLAAFPEGDYLKFAIGRVMAAAQGATSSTSRRR